MAQWQWKSPTGAWIDFSKKNNQLIDARESLPSMEKLFLICDVGEIWGSFENDNMKFRICDDHEEYATKIRRAPEPNDRPIYVVIEDHCQTILPYEAGCQLFDNDTNEPVCGPVQVISGTEEYKAIDGKLYQMIDGEERERHWTKTNISRWQIDKHTKTQFQWEFRTFRLDRMRNIVNEILSGDEISDDHKEELKEHFYEHFHPDIDQTEYGPYQFPDHLESFAKVTESDEDVGEEWSAILRELAELVREKFRLSLQNDPGDWIPFDAYTNVAIERARADGRPAVVIPAKGHVYTLIFDSGAGASGAPPTVLRPGRFEHFLESIEEQFARTTMQGLFAVLREHHIEPGEILLAQDTEEAVTRLCPPAILEQVQKYIRDMQTLQSATSARVQQFLPQLMEKFRECEVRMRPIANLVHRQLDPNVQSTAKQGLAPVPRTGSFEDMIKFIHKTQSWNMPGLKHGTCNICSSSDVPVLGGHCGSHVACLRCWTESLVRSDMHCPFCRQKVRSNQLKFVEQSSAKAAPQRSRPKKRKRSEQLVSTADILQRIHSDPLYKDVKLNTKKTTRSWFVIFLRSKLIKMGRCNSPKLRESGTKTLLTAIRDFKLLSN